MTHVPAPCISANTVNAARPCVSVGRWYGYGSFFMTAAAATATKAMKKHTTASPRRVVSLA